MSVFTNFEKFDGLKPGEISAFARKRYEDLIRNPVRLGERILPMRKVEEYEVAAGRVSFRPVTTPIVAMDSPLPRGPLGAFEAERYALLKTGLKYGMIESELKKMRDVLNMRRLSPADFAQLPPYQFANALVTGYLDRAEKMRWQALANGVIPLEKGGAQVVYNIPTLHRDVLTTTSRWGQSATADGLADLVEWDEQVYDSTGNHIEVWFMHRSTFMDLLAQESTQRKIRLAFGTTGQMINAAGGTFDNVGITRNTINQYLAMHGIGPIVLYDRRHNSQGDFTGNAQPTAEYFLPEHKVVGVAPTPVDGGTSAGLPGTATGYTADGPVAENNFAPGLHVWARQNDEPLEYQVKSAGWTLPVITDPRTLFQATVDDGL